MPTLQMPIDGELVLLDVPVRARMAVARTLVLESGFHRRTGVKIRWPDRWATKVAAGVIAEAEDPARWAARLADIAHKTAIARRMAPDSAGVDLNHLGWRLFYAQLEDGGGPSIDAAIAQIRTAWYLTGHDMHKACDTCRLLETDGTWEFLRATGTDAVLLRLYHTELQLAELLPAYPVRPGSLFHIRSAAA